MKITEKQKAEKAREIYEKYRNGDNITDDELDFVIKYLQDKVTFLSYMGDRFHFAWKELRFFLESMVDYRENRKPHHLRWLASPEEE
jgi:hypothetical protein